MSNCPRSIPPRFSFFEFFFVLITLSAKKKVYVDALGTTTTYEAYLSRLFPGINFTVRTKADSTFKIVGAASVAAKVTRDACLEGWIFEEKNNINAATDDTGPSAATTSQQLWTAERGSGYPSGVFLPPSGCSVSLERHVYRSEDPSLAKGRNRTHVRLSLHCPVFLDDGQGPPRKVCACSAMVCPLCLAMMTQGVADSRAMARIDEGQASLVKAFETGKGREKDLCAVTKDLSIRSVGSL